MNKKLLCTISLLLCVFYGFSQDLWKKTNENELQKEPKVHRSSHPTEFQLYNLDLEGLKNKLMHVPMRGDVIAQKSSVRIIFPNASGEFETFAIVETPAMEDELARKMPMIKAYAGQGVEDPSATMRFTVTQFGLHAMTLSGTKRTWYIDPYTKDGNNYMIYSKEALGIDLQGFECLTNEEVDLPSLRNETSIQRAIDDDTLRTFRLAQSCTGEYGAIFGLGTGTITEQKARVQAQMTITMTRVNGIYERDLATTMIFVANNDSVIYLDAGSDPWSNEWNTKTAQTLDAVIGVNNYDIGHNFNTTGGGNAGCLFCVCTSTSQTGTHKGRGYTGRADPTGDPFDVDYVAHEMGHQFGGYHTMNSCSRSGGTYNDGIGSEVEPASGSTIMGYAGICSVNVQNNSDAYFHFVNIADISDNLQNGASSGCAAETSIGNAAPTADAGSDLIIPISTPYALTGISTDADGTASHTFTWEQIDNEQRTQEAPQASYNDGPLTRSFEGTTNPTRYIPRLEDLRTSNGSTTWEVLSSVARDINFALTVKDNNAAGGQTADDLKKLTTTSAAGPFLVTSQNTATTWLQGDTQTVTWDVAGTTGNGVNTANVDILFSTDGGLTYPTVLATGVANNGSADIIVPTGESPNCRVMVKGTNHIFFNINTAIIEVSGAVFPSVSYATTEMDVVEGSDCTYTDVTVPLTIGLPPSANATANFTIANATATSGEDFDLMTPSVLFAAGATESQDLVIRVYSDGFVEADEIVTVDFTLTTSGDAVASTNSMTLTISNDDAISVATQYVSLLSSDFEATDNTAWTAFGNDGDTRDWLCCYSGVTYPGITNFFAASESQGGLLPNTSGNNIKPDNFYHNTNAITIPTMATNVNFSYGVGGFQDAEPYEVYWTTDVSSVATITGGISLGSGTTPSGGGVVISLDVTNISGQSGYVVFRHLSTSNGPAGTSGLLLLDNVVVTATIPTFIQTAVNSGTTNDSLILSGAGTVYTTDDSGELMLDITNNDTFNYGCTDVSVSRSGTSGQAYNGSTLPNHVMDKTFTITPTNTTTSGDVTTAFYFDATEISGWETATGLTSGDLVALREGTGEIVPLAVSAFGGNTILTGTFTGLSGTYYFGPEDAFRVTVAPKVYLQGAALNPNGSEPTIMRDDLRVDGLIPTVSPFADNLTFNASVLNVTGANAIVDWVQVELRDQNTNTTIIASQSALLQRDGDVVGVDGVSPLVFNYPSADYYVSVRHKSHLGIMSANAILMTAATKTVDFTDGTTATFGTDAQTTFGMPSGILGMWAGDANGDGRLNYSGALSDVPTIRSQVFNDPDNSVFGGPPTATYPSEGYFGTDTDMDGVTVYSGATSDVLYLRNNIFNNPSNSVFGGPPTATYVFIQQLPEGANN